MKFLSKVAPRLYQNYFMPNRLAEYREMLSGILARGYRFITVAEFAQVVWSGTVPAGKVAILRVDVDSDPKGARRMFEVQRSLGVRATCYFRLSTIDHALIGEMANASTEVGYHFEELSALARRRGIHDVAGAEHARETLRQHFRQNLERFRQQTGVAPRTVAAHGDFLNRRMGLRNNWFVDRALLDELGLVAEVYETWLVRQVTARVADRAAPRWWHPQSPEEVLQASPAVLLLVVHPRQWVRNPLGNTVEDVERAGAEIQYWLNRLRVRA